MQSSYSTYRIGEDDSSDWQYIYASNEIRKSLLCMLIHVYFYIYTHASTRLFYKKEHSDLLKYSLVIKFIS